MVIMQKPKQYEQFFPLGLASGAAFIGREAEIDLIQRNIEVARHTLLLSPRKYGKTSLVKYVIKSQMYIASDIDLFLATNTETVVNKLLKAIHMLLKQICKQHEKWLKTLSQYFQKANKEWTVGIKGLQLQLIPERNVDSAETILEALKALEFVLKKNKQRAILFIDEFQEIAHLDENKAIQGAIRHFAQSSEYLMLIFSGSNRHLLEMIFNNNTQPLYDLCERIILTRIEESDYKTYLKKVSKLTFGDNLQDDVFDKIMELSDRHPKVVYILCKKIWDLCYLKNIHPDVKQVINVWESYIDLTHKDTRAILNGLTSNQLAILLLIAQGCESGLTGKKYTRQLNVTSGAISQALEVLEQKDYIESRAELGYRVIDPVIKSTLLRYLSA